MGEPERKEKALGTLVTAVVSGLLDAARQHTAQSQCVDFRDGNAELVVYLTNGKELKISPSKKG